MPIINHFEPQSKARDVLAQVRISGVYAQLTGMARRRFGARLRAARRAENRILWAGLAALEATR